GWPPSACGRSSARTRGSAATAPRAPTSSGRDGPLSTCGPRPASLLVCPCCPLGTTRCGGGYLETNAHAPARAPARVRRTLSRGTVRHCVEGPDLIIDQRFFVGVPVSW